MRELKRAPHQYFHEMIAVSGAFLAMTGTGIHLTWASPIIAMLTDETNPNAPFHIKISQTPLLASLQLFGYIFGALSIVPLAKYMTHRQIIFISSFPIGISFIIFACYQTLNSFYYARFIAGFGTGLAASVANQYIGEITSPNIRGICALSMSFGINFGCLLTYCVIPFLSITTSSLLFLIIPMLQLILGCILPESPYMYLIQNSEIQAQKALQKLRLRQDVTEELSEMKVFVKNELMVETTFMGIISYKPNLKAFGFCTLLMCGQVLTGALPLISYSQKVFEQVDKSNLISANACGIWFISMNLIVIFFASMAMNRTGIRLLVILSSILISIPLITLGTYFYLEHLGWNLDQYILVPLFAMMAFNGCHGLGLGTGIFVGLSELFPTHVKSLGGCLMGAFACVLGILNIFAFENLSRIYGKFVPIWIYAIVALVLAVVYYLVLPETKGKSFDQIQDILKYGEKVVAKKKRSILVI